jgi:hypothetical protein
MPDLNIGPSHPMGMQQHQRTQHEIDQEILEEDEEKKIHLIR